jgi:hypothetical protein
MSERQPAFAARITMNNVQLVMRMEGADVNAVIAEIDKAVQDRTPLTLVHEDDEHATMVIPGPGMAVQFLPWDQWLEQQEKLRKQQEAAQAQGNGGIPRVLMPRGFPPGAGRAPRR